MTTTRAQLFEKLNQLENWTDQLGEYMANTAQAVADTRKHAELLAELLDASAVQMLRRPQTPEAVLAYLELRQAS